MTSFILKRLGFAVVTLVAVLSLVFFIVRILPGDPAMVILGDQANAASIAALRTKLGLDRPLLVQYFVFLSGAVRGDWGVSMVSGRPVIAEVLSVLPNTIELTLVSLVLGVIIGVPAGVWAAVNRNRIPDYRDPRRLPAGPVGARFRLRRSSCSSSSRSRCNGFRSSAAARIRASAAACAISRFPRSTSR